MIQWRSCRRMLRKDRLSAVVVNVVLFLAFAVFVVVCVCF